MPAYRVDVEDYKRLYRRTRDMEPKIRRDLRKHLREAGNIGRDAARLKIREWSGGGGAGKYTAAGHGRHTRRGRSVGLRSTIAINIRTTVGPSDVTIRQFTVGLSGNSTADLPYDIDRGGWRHPTFGHRPRVFQRGIHYFHDEIESKRPQMEREMAKVLDEIRAEVVMGEIGSFLSLRG